MALKAFCAVLLTILISAVQGRILSLNSSDNDLISDGVDRVEGQSLRASSCDHQYGFLPCAENAAGYIFQIIVYQGLLIYGEKQIGKGSKVLFNIIGAGKFGGIIFRILMSLPSMMMMIVSGAYSSKENAQSQVSIGVGIFAGMTVFSLTLQWGMVVIAAKRDLPKSSDYEQIVVTNTNCLPAAKEKFAKLKDTGVTIDSDTQKTAGIMLLSLIPYIIVQLDDIFNMRSGLINLIGLIVSSLSLLAYFIYQILNPWIRERSLDYSKYEMLRAGFLQHVKQHGKLVNEDGKLNTEVIKELFSETDKDADKNVTKLEMEKLVLEIIKSGNVQVDENFAVQEVMKTFDLNDDRFITEEEFVDGCKKWIDESNTQSAKSKDLASKYIYHEVCELFKQKKEHDPREIDRIMSKILTHCQSQLLQSEALVTPNGKPNMERIKTLFRKFDCDGNNTISKTELKELISTVQFGDSKPNYEDVIKELFKDFDKDRNHEIDEPEFVEGVTRWLERAVRVADITDNTKTVEKFDEIVWKKHITASLPLFISIFQVTLGIAMLTFLGGPLMNNILQLSFSMNLPTFSISFVVVPLAMNARSLLSALLPASHKSERSASLTFSEIYGGVVMNNISGLTTLMAIVYAKDLTFNFSAEVLTIMVACAVIGLLAFSRTTYPLWTSILAFSLYPFSLGLFYFVQFFLKWN